MENRVHEKGYRNRPLSDQQKASNREKSKTRARVEHVFGFMEQSINGLDIAPKGSLIFRKGKTCRTFFNLKEWGVMNCSIFWYPPQKKSIFRTLPKLRGFCKALCKLN